MYEERELDFSSYVPDDEDDDNYGFSRKDSVDEGVDKLNEKKRKDMRLLGRQGQKYRFVITVLDAFDISPEFVDVFCQFRFMKSSETAFSTESLQNTSGKLQYYHAQQICVDVTDRFIEYLENEVVIFELFGHYESHPMHGNVEPSPQEAKLKNQIKSLVGDEEEKPVDEPTYPKHQLLIWYEICELGPSGEYMPVSVSRDRGSYFHLQQGVQRRVRITISHEAGQDLEWERVVDLSIGNIRTVYEDVDGLAVTS